MFQFCYYFCHFFFQLVHLTLDESSVRMTDSKRESLLACICIHLVYNIVFNLSDFVPELELLEGKDLVLLRFVGCDVVGPDRQVVL